MSKRFPCPIGIHRYHMTPETQCNPLIDIYTGRPMTEIMRDFVDRDTSPSHDDAKLDLHKLAYALGRGGY